MAPEQITLPLSPLRGAAMRLCHGPRAAESALFEDLDRWLGEEPGAALERPVLVVVPSLSLRAHLLARYAARRGRAVLGFACRTLFHVAVDLCERQAPLPPLNQRLHRILARRFAAREPALAASLEDLRDGYAAVAGSVTDLLDAGLDPAHAEALDELLSSDGPTLASRHEIERARAEIRVGCATAAALEALGVERVSGLLRRAAGLVRTDAGEAARPSALAVYGFGDATGVATDLLEPMLDRWAGTLYLDQPRDPADRGRADAGVRFTRRFRERLEAVARPLPEAATAPPGRVELFRAPGAAAEAREVARRILVRLGEGLAPESIGVVARRLEPYRVPLRRQLEALGVPFSGVAAGVQSPVGRRLRGLLALVEGGGRTPVDRWLELRPTDPEGARREDLRLALFQLGAGRLAQAAAVEAERHLRHGRYRLPVAVGFARPREEGECEPEAGSRSGAEERSGVQQGSGGGEGATESDAAARRRPTSRSRTARRTLPGEALAAVVEGARRTVARLEALSRCRELGPIAAELRRLVVDELGWSAESGAGQALLEELASATRGLPGDLPLAAAELVRLLEPGLERRGALPLGGAGGGVQVLDVIEARGRTFEHLFLIGLNRGEFPRAVREDPALPDALRRLLGRTGHGLLPDLPSKLDGFDEERYLFAQLADAAPRVTISWQAFDEEGARQTRSPLVERLRWSAAERGDGGAAEPALAPTPFSASTAAGGPPRPAREEAIVAGLYGDRDRFAAALELALADSGVEAGAARTLAGIRRRILDEVDPVFRTPQGEATRRRLGPYLGLGALPPADPEQPLWVTTLERLAVCPWQSFLGRVLRLEPLPDPLELLPAIDPRSIGNLVHRVLDRVARRDPEDRGGALSEVLDREPFEPDRPSAAALFELSREVAERLLAEEGVSLPGFADALARVVEPYLATAFELDWEAAGAPRVLGAEVEGELRLADGAGRERSVRFRADRVDRTERGPLLTDYKTGGGELSGDERRAAAVLERKTQRGEWLQAMAYALGAGEPGARGRYLLLKPDPDTPAGARRLEVEATPEIAARFERVVAIALEIWDRALLFPRLVRPDRDGRPAACRYCEVAEACVQGDSGARGRLREWVERRAGGELDAIERAVVELWWLPAGGPPAAGPAPSGGRQ